MTIPEIQIGDKTIKQAQFVYWPNPTEEDQNFKSLGFWIDGSLGMDVYRQFIWDIDNQNKKLHINSVNDSPPENNYK